MQVIKNNKTLTEAINQLELQKQTEEVLLKEHFQHTLHSLNPLTIIKEKFSDTISSPTLTGDLLKSTAGLATGLISNNFIKGPVGLIVGKLLSSIVKNNISKVSIPDPIVIKNSGISFLQKTLEKMKID